MNVDEQLMPLSGFLMVWFFILALTAAVCLKHLALAVADWLTAPRRSPR